MRKINNRKRLNSFQAKQRRMQSEKVLYHITPVEEYSSILKEGLKCNEYGETFLMEFAKNMNKKDMMDICCHVAGNQIFTDHFTIINIDSKGINSMIHPENVAELPSPYQRYIEQDIIEPKYLDVIGHYDRYETSPLTTPILIDLLNEPMKSDIKYGDLKLSKKQMKRFIQMAYITHDSTIIE